jgi:phosphoserine phosphatase
LARYPVVFFDLDGTLLRGTTVSQLLAGWLGRGGALDELEYRYRRGEVSNADVASASAPWFSGRRAADAWEALGPAPWIGGIEETIAALRAVGSTPVLATVTWRFAAELVARRFGFEAWSGTGMAERGGVLDGTVSEHFDADAKRTFAERFCEERGLALSGAAAVGDSRSDVPLFAGVGLSIALNADEQARRAADVALESDDLRDVLALLT